MQISACRSYFEALKGEIPAKAGLFDEGETIIASTESELEGSKFEKSGIEEYKLFKFSEGFSDYTLFIETLSLTEPEISAYTRVISASLSALLKIDNEINDSDYFIKKIINGTAEDIATTARIFKIPSEAIRVIMILKAEPKHVENIIDVIRNLAVGSKDFVFENNSGEIVFLRTCKTEPSSQKLLGIAREISEMVAEDVYEFVSIGIGMVVYNLPDIEKSYKSALNALEIGEIFVNKNKIYSYSNLGISRLISSVPIGKCKAFLNEILPEKVLSEIDDETLNSIQKFLDCDMNIASAAKALYVHRNTMVYRLDRLQKLTGLDVRKFEDAMLFKIAMMIHKYLSATRR